MNDNLEEYLKAMVLLRRVAKKNGMKDRDIDDFISTYGEGIFLFAQAYYKGQKAKDDLKPTFRGK